MMASRVLLAGLLGAVTAPALAQSDDASLMPEGSSDVWAGAILVNGPRAAGGTERITTLLPQFGAEWSNGVFLDGLVLGKQMSSSPLLKYGPLLALNLVTRPGDGGKTLRPVFGAFLRYRPLRELGLQAQILGAASHSGSGVVLNLAANTQADLAPHQWLAFSLGIDLADRAYMQSDFGTARYHPAGGVRDLYAAAELGWQLTPKVKMVASTHASRLQGDAAASPFTRQRNGVVNALAFSYSY